jgi:hypothetical protein
MEQSSSFCSINQPQRLLSETYAAEQSVTRFIASMALNLVTPKDSAQLKPGGWFVKCLCQTSE